MLSTSLIKTWLHFRSDGFSHYGLAEALLNLNHWRKPYLSAHSPPLVQDMQIFYGNNSEMFAFGEQWACERFIHRSVAPFPARILSRNLTIREIRVSGFFAELRLIT